MKNIMKKIALCVLLSKAVYCIEISECLKEKKIEKSILAVTKDNILEKIKIIKNNIQAGWEEHPNKIIFGSGLIPMIISVYYITRK